MNFEWDPAKNRINLKKHGIDFQDAQTIWNGWLVTFQSTQSEHGEIRYLAIGLYQEREIAVVYTHRKDRIRLISARRARKNERETYRKSTEQNRP